MAKIGLIAGSYKPFHAGHMGLINIASKQNNEVHLYVSVTDRKRPGEVPILGSDMAEIWRDQIEPTLPGNVHVTYGGSPVGNVWKELGAANESNSTDSFTIYGDPTDVAQNFPDNLLTKYCGNLFRNGQIKLSAIERATTTDVSGTQMRKYIAAGDKERFISMLPPNLDGEAIWNKLYSSSRTASKKTSPKAKVEGLLRQLVSETIAASVRRGSA